MLYCSIALGVINSCRGYGARNCLLRCQTSAFVFSVFSERDRSVLLVVVHNTTAGRLGQFSAGRPRHVGGLRVISGDV